jgi:hypothetical protein
VYENDFGFAFGFGESGLKTKDLPKFFTVLVANNPMSTRVQMTLATSGSTASAVNFDCRSSRYPPINSIIRT